MPRWLVILCRTSATASGSAYGTVKNGSLLDAERSEFSQAAASVLLGLRAPLVAFGARTVYAPFAIVWASSISAGSIDQVIGVRVPAAAPTSPPSRPSGLTSAAR